MGRYGEEGLVRGRVGRLEGRYGEIWGDMGRKDSCEAEWGGSMLINI